MTPCQLLNNSYGEFATFFFCFHIAQKRDVPLANEVRVVCHPDVMQTISARGEINKTTAQWYKYFANFPKLCGSLSDCVQAGRSGDRIPAGSRFFAPVLTGPEAHPASCTMGTGSFPGVKCGRSVTLTPHPF